MKIKIYGVKRPTTFYFKTSENRTLSEESFKNLIYDIECHYNKKNIDLRVDLDFEQKLYRYLTDRLQSGKYRKENKIYVELAENGFRNTLVFTNKHGVMKQRIIKIIFYFVVLILILGAIGYGVSKISENLAV